MYGVVLTPQVYEDELDEEMTRPTEKVVNMSIAPGELLAV